MALSMGSCVLLCRSADESRLLRSKAVGLIVDRLRLPLRCPSTIRGVGLLALPVSSIRSCNDDTPSVVKRVDPRRSGGVCELSKSRERKNVEGVADERSEGSVEGSAADNLRGRDSAWSSTACVGRILRHRVAIGGATNGRDGLGGDKANVGQGCGRDGGRTWSGHGSRGGPGGVVSLAGRQSTRIEVITGCCNTLLVEDT